MAAGGLLYPELLGPGREGIQLMLFGQLAGATALMLGLLKIVTAGLTMAGGGAGGVFTPSLFVGAAFGSFFGLTLQQLLPGLDVNAGAFALVGMAGLLAGSTAAPLTAILMVFEMTGDYGLILPLMLVGVLSYQELARALSEQELAVLLVAADLMMERPETVTPGDSLLEAMERMSARDLDFIPVVHEEDGDRLAGLLRRADIMETYQAHLMLPG